VGKVLPAIGDELRDFMEAQPIFFVATAPRGDGGHVNLSPKGLDTFRVLGPHRVAYLDLTGSGNETAAHLLENGRITVMFCAFSGPPRILRLYGRGHLVLPDDPAWPELRANYPEISGSRQIVGVEVERVQTSCGFGVPLMELIGPRDNLIRWATSKGPAGIREYQAEKNATSIDGLPTPFTGKTTASSGSPAPASARTAPGSNGGSG
jgi:hypothetical protein